jgi:hypothetical protein
MTQAPWHLTGSRTKAAAAAMVPPFPDPVQPEAPPFDVIPAPDHVSNEKWQTSFYDASSDAPMGAFRQRPAGPCSLVTGRLTDSDWADAGPWKQV